MQNLGEIITITQTHFHPSCSSPRTNDVFCSVRSGTALPAELELYCKCALPFSPVFFFNLFYKSFGHTLEICSNSLFQFETLT